MTDILTFVRHAQSENNTGNKIEKDTRLTLQGKEMCKNIKGKYELVICSTLWRAKETLLNSHLDYDTVIYSDLCREQMNKSADNYQIREDILPETEREFKNRCKKFQILLDTLSGLYNSICVISHSGTLTELVGGRKFRNAEMWTTDIDTYLDGYSLL